MASAKTVTIALIGCILAFITLFSDPALAFTVIESQSGYQVETSSLTCIVTGKSNVPKFTIISKGNGTIASDDSRVKIQFQSMYQTTGVDSLDKLPQSNVALSSLKWQFSNWKSDGENLTFSLTSSGNDFGSLSFDVKIREYQTEFKFDVIMKDVPASFWVQDAGALALSYKVIEQKSGGDSEKDAEVKQEKKGTEERVVIGSSAYMDVEGTATSGNKTQQVNTKASSSVVTTTYEKFDGSLYHDPTMGFTGGASASVLSFACVVVAAAVFALIA